MWFNVISKSVPERHATYTFDHPDGRCVATAFGFDTASTRLRPSHHALLRHFAKHFESGTYLEVFARADRVGSDAANLWLSQERAREVRKVLVGYGVPAGALWGFYCRALGERLETRLGLPDAVASQGGRTVWLFAWPSQAAYAQGVLSNFSDLIRAGRTVGVAA